LAKEARPLTAEQTLGAAWERGGAGNWNEKLLARGLRPKGAESRRHDTPEEMLRSACPEGLHPKAWPPEKIARTAFVTAQGSASLKDDTALFDTRSSMKQQVRACTFVAGAGLELQAEKLLGAVERGGEVAGINFQHDGTSMPLMFENPDTFASLAGNLPDLQKTRKGRKIGIVEVWQHKAHVYIAAPLRPSADGEEDEIHGEKEGEEEGEEHW